MSMDIHQWVSWGNFSSEGAKFYALEYLLTEEVKEAVQDNLIHIHDLDFYAAGTTTCSQIPLSKLLKDGFFHRARSYEGTKMH
ncbi:hypothetical protein GCM10020331_050110 [Ectobacillus funiculus]